MRNTPLTHGRPPPLEAVRPTKRAQRGKGNLLKEKDRSMKYNQQQQKKKHKLRSQYSVNRPSSAAPRSAHLWDDPALCKEIQRHYFNTRNDNERKKR
jgi:hypothetical protein